MEYRAFGKTDLKVSVIGFGCWEIGGTYGRIDRGQFDRAVHQAIDSGITCFDTAEAYGMGVSEEALAEALGPRRNRCAKRCERHLRCRWIQVAIIAEQTCAWSRIQLREVSKFMIESNKPGGPASRIFFNSQELRAGSCCIFRTM